MKKSVSYRTENQENKIVKMVLLLQQLLNQELTQRQQLCRWERLVDSRPITGILVGLLYSLFMPSGSCQANFKSVFCATVQQSGLDLINWSDLLCRSFHYCCYFCCCCRWNFLGIRPRHLAPICLAKVQRCPDHLQRNKNTWKWMMESCRGVDVNKRTVTIFLFN